MAGIESAFNAGLVYFTDIGSDVPWKFVGGYRDIWHPREFPTCDAPLEMRAGK
jgi:hypothetical protein